MANKAELVRGNSDLDSFRSAVSALNQAASQLLEFGQALNRATEVSVYQAAGLEQQVAPIFEVQAKNIASIEEPLAELNKILSNAIDGMEIAEKQAASNVLNGMLD